MFTFSAVKSRSNGMISRKKIIKFSFENYKLIRLVE